MSTVTLSEAFELPVPAEVRELLHLKVGARFQVVPYGGRLEFIPIRNPGELRGFARGMNTDIERDDRDRL